MDLEDSSTIKEVEPEFGKLRDRQNQIEALHRKQDVQNYLRKMWDRLENSPSQQRRRVIQTVIKAVIYDQETEELHTYINPNLNCHKSEETVRLRNKWRTNGPKPEIFSSTPHLLVTSAFYVEPLYKDKFFLHQKYVIEGLSARQIAAELFSSKSVIIDSLKGFGIPVREPHQPHGHPSQLRFGQKFLKGKLKPHLQEQRIVEAVKMLNAQGLTLREIAKMLTQMKVPTKENGKKWHPEMVRRVLNGNKLI